MGLNGLFASWFGDDKRLKEYEAAQAARRDTLDPVAFCRRFWFAYLSPARTGDTTIVNAGAPDVCDAAPAVLIRAPAVAVRIYTSFGARDLRSEMPKVTAPTLLLWGDRIGFYNDIAQSWRDSIRTSKSLTLPGAWPQFPWLGAPQATFGALDAFLRGGWPAGAK
jgi:hypothetical protein